MRIKYQIAYVSFFLFSFSFWLNLYVLISYFFPSIFKKVNPAVFFDFSFWKKTAADYAHDCARPQFMNTIRNLSNMIEDLHEYFRV